MHNRTISNKRNKQDIVSHRGSQLPGQIDVRGFVPRETPADKPVDFQSMFNRSAQPGERPLMKSMIQEGRKGLLGGQAPVPCPMRSRTKRSTGPSKPRSAPAAARRISGAAFSF
eukprot:NODE_3295_length_415_cov_0.647260_g3267_i0.p1 GENE.NODE_3295_length_415_cov_0.647260_g3267_i0~~NODE_3295_length_415_cov_0.647260_g3267_i0.p1  ORF type:complete len:114 (-),score=7.57 NODE_3295_length_415_cov_0.647260_g3267_i0:74-415(-)